ncbi:MAG: hypothetical protein ABIP49_03105, partial [Lysobacterales bacterium]
RRYNEAIQASEGSALSDPRAYPLLLEAIALDSTFAMAYRKLAWLEPNPARKAQWATKGWQLRQRLTDVERYQAEGMYHWMATKNLDAAIEAHIKAFAADSTVPRNAGNLVQLYTQKGDLQQALLWADRLAKIDSSQGSVYRLPVLISLGRDADAERDQRVMNGRFGARSGAALQYRLIGALARRQLDSVPVFAAPAPDALPASRMLGRAVVAVAELTQGRFKSALARLDSLRPIGAQSPDALPYLAHGMVAGWFLGDSARAHALIDSVLHASPLPSRPSPEVVFHIARAYSMSHLPAQAREWMARYDRQADTLERTRTRDTHPDAQGWAALADNRPQDAIRYFRLALDAGIECRPCARAQIGAAYDAAGQTDSTLAIYQELLATRDFDNARMMVPTWEGLMRRRTGELFEARGNGARALASYRSFVELMKNADDELQPQVRDIRARIARLERAENLKR